MYLFDRVCEPKQELQREREAGSPLSGEPDAGLYPRTSGS